MQKFFVVVLVTLLGLSTAVQGVPVEGDALLQRDTNAARFARGMPPLPPVKRTEAAKRHNPSPQPHSH
ncbi:hypothetical protein BJV78DRAFT_1283786 [Lactifluus subvellereus]|nr:hypothetical protein BJV78DRAFT_1283786 [Lactifluus subvellereus]